MIIDGIYVEADCSIPEETVLQEVAQERANWLTLGKPLGMIQMHVDDGGIVIESYERSPIRRVRRITGYLSNIDSFNDAKKQEAKSRIAHVKI